MILEVTKYQVGDVSITTERHAHFMVVTKVPDCSNCGKNEYEAAVFEHEGQLFRCVPCGCVFQPKVEVTFTATIAPSVSKIVATLLYHPVG